MNLLPKVDVSRVLDRGAGFFSFIIGFGIAVMLFHRPYTVENILALEPGELRNKVVQHNSRCYRYRVEDASCDFSTSL